MTDDQREDDAAILVADALGVTWKRHDFNTGESQHDFDLVDADGTVSALEVSSVADHEQLSRANAIGRHAGEIYETSTLCRDWAVSFGPGGKIKRFGPDVEPALVGLEGLGIDRAVRGELWGPGRADLGRQFEKLGITYASSWEPADGGTTGSIMATAGNSGGAGGSDDAATFLEAWLHGPRCVGDRKKLEASNASRRHLFLFASITELPLWIPLAESGDPPTQPIALPAEITDVWASDFAVTWHYNASDGWARLIDNAG